MPNNITELRRHLFETLEALKRSDNPMEIDRAKAISQVAQAIIDSARVEVKFAEMTGQETVSRLHFRGHPNRHLRGLLFEADPPAAPASGWSAVTHEERDVGRVTSIAWLPDGGGSVLGRWIGLAIVRREVALGATVRAAGREARVVGLPFDAPRVAPA